MVRTAGVLITVVAITLGSTWQASAQTGSTGALSGITLDPSGAALPEVIVRLVNPKTLDTRYTTSDGEGRFAFLLLPPDTYDVQASKTNFGLAELRNLTVHVTETLRVEIPLNLAGRVELASS
jgi:hypothetical protein